MLGSSEFDHTDHTTTSKACAYDDFGMYNPLRMIGEDERPYNIGKAQADGMLESIVNQATGAKKVRQNTQKYYGEVDNDYNDIDGFEVSPCVVPTTENGNTITKTMDALVPCFSNTCGYADAWLTDINEEQESQLVIQNEDELLLPEDDFDLLVVPGKNDEVVLPQGYADQTSLFTGDSEDTFHVGNNINETKVDDMNNVCPSACEITRSSSMNSSSEPERVSASKKLSSSRKRKGKAAASRKHNQSEQTRRDVISKKMKALHDLVPYHSKKASKALILTEVNDYVKLLQAQVETLLSTKSTVPCMMMGYPMAANAWQMNNMYPMMYHPQMNTAMMDTNTINTHTGSSPVPPAVFIHPTAALSPYLPESHQVKAMPLIPSLKPRQTHIWGGRCPPGQKS